MSQILCISPQPPPPFLVPEQILYNKTNNTGTVVWLVALILHVPSCSSCAACHTSQPVSTFQSQQMTDIRESGFFCTAKYKTNVKLQIPRFIVKCYIKRIWQEHCSPLCLLWEYKTSRILADMRTYYRWHLHEEIFAHRWRMEVPGQYLYLEFVQYMH